MLSINVYNFGGIVTKYVYNRMHKEGKVYLNIRGSCVPSIAIYSFYNIFKMLRRKLESCSYFCEIVILEKEIVKRDRRMTDLTRRYWSIVNHPIISTHRFNTGAYIIIYLVNIGWVYLQYDLIFIFKQNKEIE